MTIETSPSRSAPRAAIRCTTLATALSLACADSATTTDGVGPSSALTGMCGEVSVMDEVEITGGVRSTVDQQWLPDVYIELVETNWDPGTVHGATRSDDNGQFQFTVNNITVVEECWGLAVSYWLTGEQGAWSGDKPMNPLLIEAWESGDRTQSLGQFPLLMYPP